MAELPAEQNGSDNVRPVSKRGINDPSYVLARLKRDIPDLAQKVIKGELSANAAAIQAGFKVKSISVPVEPVAAGRRLVRHFDKHQLETLCRVILDAIND